MSDNKTLLVTGAGGHLGRQVVERLIEAGAGSVIATTRKPERLADLAARGVDVRAADFDRPEDLAAAFHGAKRLLLISTDALGTPGQRITQHRAAIAEAVKAGVEHIIYLSGPAPHPSETSQLIDDHYWTEQALAASGLGFTALRDHLYTDFLLYSLPHAIATGSLVTATGKGGRNYVWREDCARTAAGVLASDYAGRQVLDVTGPAPLSGDELAALVSEITGRPLKHVAVAPDDLKAGLIGAGVPAPIAAGLVEFDVDAAQGFHAVTTPVVRDSTGREPKSVREFLLANRQALLAAA